MDDKSFNFEKDYDWTALVAGIGGGMGGGAEAWLAEYSRVGGEIFDDIRWGLAQLRRREMEEGLARLDRARSRWEPLRDSSPAIYHVLGRYYHGALAYWHYCVDDFPRADESLRQALDAVRLAVEAEPFLLPFAAVSMDIPLKQAQIARALRRWREMRERLAAIRDTVQDRAPLFTLSDGTPIYHHTLAASLHPESLRSEAGKGLAYLTDEPLRLEIFDQWVEVLYDLPDWVIPYP